MTCVLKDVTMIEREALRGVGMRDFRKILLIVVILSVVFLFSSCGNKEVDEGNTIQNIVIWSYYTGEQKAMFDEVVAEFNDGVGKEKGIVVNHQVFGNPYELDEALLSSVKEDAGSLDAPDMFVTYRGIDRKVKEHRELLDFYNYYSDEEIAGFIDSFVDMGVVHEEDGDKLYMFPIAKSQTIVMLNETDFEDLKEKIGIDYDDLKTYNKLIEAARKYYEYTDSLTEEPYDGKALFGMDSVTNYFLLSAKALGGDFLERKDGETVVNFSKETARTIWDNYYVPMVRGYFGREARYATEDIKIGKLLLSSGSTAGTLYFPHKKYVNDVGYDIEMKILSVPYIEGKEKMFYIQGGGLFALKGSDEKNNACVEFLKWFTAPEQNAEFAINSGYLPVTKKAFNKDFIETYLSENNVEDHISKTLMAAYEQYETMTPYVHYPVEGFKDIRYLISDEFSKFTEHDVKSVRERLESGEDYDEVMSYYLSDDYFDSWYDSFVEKVEATLELQK